MLQAVGSGCAFLDECRVLLRHLIEPIDGVANLADALRLLVARGADLGDRVGDAAHLPDDVLH